MRYPRSVIEEILPSGRIAYDSQNGIDGKENLRIRTLDQVVEELVVRICLPVDRADSEYGCHDSLGKTKTYHIAMISGS